MAISTYAAELHYASSSTGTYAKLVDIKDFPDLIGDPNTLETTTLSDSQQTFIPGIKSSDTLQFTANYTSTDFSTVKGLEGTEYYWKLIFNDAATASTGTGSTFSWTGKVTAGLPGKGVDEVVEMTINIVPTSTVSFAAAT